MVIPHPAYDASYDGDWTTQWRVLAGILTVPNARPQAIQITYLSVALF